MEDRRKINRGIKKLRVWQDAVALYVLACEKLSGFPFELGKAIANAIDASQSISRNIVEGYCRRSLKKKLNFLDTALASCGEFHSSCFSFMKAKQISKEDFAEIDQLHFKVENQLIKLIETIQNKKTKEYWLESFA